MNVAVPTAFSAPERLAALRNDIAARRRARLVNCGILCGQHGAALRGLARRDVDKSARAAVERLVAAGSRHEPWTPATTRDLRAVVCGFAAAADRLAASRSVVGLAWHLDRLRELLAQDDAISELEAALYEAWPAGVSALLVREAAAAGARKG